MGVIKNRVVMETNDKGYLLYSESFIGAYTRGKTREEALSKFQLEIQRYCKWAGIDFSPYSIVESIIVQTEKSELRIEEADSEVIFHSEKAPMLERDYEMLKSRALKSANDFQILYDSILHKDYAPQKERLSFYGPVPSTAKQMYDHTNYVTNYYVGEIGIKMKNLDNIYENRIQAIQAIEDTDRFLENKTFNGSYGEQWSLRKVLRRFIWHDCIHAKGMYRMATNRWGEERILNPFYF